MLAIGGRTTVAVAICREAIVRWSEDPKLYAEKQRACAGLQPQFYDRGNSWYSAMRRVLEPYAVKR